MYNIEDFKEAAIWYLQQTEPEDFDPYELISYNHPKGYAICPKKEAWKFAAESLAKQFYARKALEGLGPERTASTIAYPLRRFSED